jgi:branched-chain amino acid transport system substrate-binding protein
MAGLAIANEEPSIIGVQHFITAANAVGLPVGYKNFSIPIGTVNVGPTVLGMQQAHVNGFFSEMLNTTDFAIMTAAKQEGLKLAAPIDYTSYTQDLLDNASALQGAQGIISYVQQVPVEEHTPATLQEQAAFEKYEHFSGVPNLNWTYGWLAADLFIKGLQGAGSNPTRTSFLNALHNTTNWTAGGLLAQAPDLSLAGFGHAPSHSCAYFTQLKGSAYVPLSGGKPVCGNAVS